MVLRTAFIKHILPVLTKPRGSRNGMVNDPVGLIWKSFKICGIDPAFPFDVPLG